MFGVEESLISSKGKFTKQVGLVLALVLHQKKGFFFPLNFILLFAFCISPFYYVKMGSLILKHIMI